MSKKIELGSILESNDKLYTGLKKKRHVVVTYLTENKKGVSRILSLKGKESKVNKTLMPIKKYPSLPEPSGVDYEIYYKAKNNQPLNFGSMKNTGDILDPEDMRKVSHHVKRRGGSILRYQNKRFKRK